MHKRKIVIISGAAVCLVLLVAWVKTTSSANSPTFDVVTDSRGAPRLVVKPGGAQVQGTFWMYFTGSTGGRGNERQVSVASIDTNGVVKPCVIDLNGEWRRGISGGGGSQMVMVYSVSQTYPWAGGGSKNFCKFFRGFWRGSQFFKDLAKNFQKFELLGICRLFKNYPNGSKIVQKFSISSNFPKRFQNFCISPNFPRSWSNRYPEPTLGLGGGSENFCKFF